MAYDVDLLRHGIDDLRGRGRYHIANLVRDTGERGAEGRRRKLVQVDGDHAPGALDEELHEEAGGGQRALGSGKDPRGDDATAEECRGDDGASSPEVLAEVADDSTANCLFITS